MSKFVIARRLAPAALIIAILCCVPARAQILEQVPADAFAVLEIKNLAKVSAKVAKMAKAIGADELVPELNDPLAKLLELMKVQKGIDTSGDVALALFAPKGFAGEPVVVGMIAVSDYDAFLGNFKKTGGPDADGISEFTGLGGALATTYAAHHGEYAVFCDQRSFLKDHGGLRLSKAAAQEASAKDAVFLLNMPIVRKLVVSEIEKNRGDMINQLHREIDSAPAMKPYLPVIDAVVKELLDGTENFFRDSTAVVLCANVSDEGISVSGLLDFAPDSKFGTAMAAFKPGKAPLLAGLPSADYLMFAGVSPDSKALGHLLDDLLDPILDALAQSGTDSGKQIAEAFKAGQGQSRGPGHVSTGLLMPTGPIGKTSLYQLLLVVNDDFGKGLPEFGQIKPILVYMLDVFDKALPTAGANLSPEFGPAKVVDEVDLFTFFVDMKPIANDDPQGLAEQRTWHEVFGPRGVETSFGIVNGKALVELVGISDQLANDVIHLVKMNMDVLSSSADVKAVSTHLPAGNSAVLYVAVDHIFNTVIRYAPALGTPIHAAPLPALPPIGVAITSVDSSIRIDGFITTKTARGMITAGKVLNDPDPAK